MTDINFEDERVNTQLSVDPYGNLMVNYFEINDFGCYPMEVEVELEELERAIEVCRRRRAEYEAYKTENGIE